METTRSLPDGVTVRNTCSQIHLTPSARFLYVGNRGHNSIAGFAVDRATGRLTPAGHAPTEAVPTAFGLDSGGSLLFAAGTASGRLASYRINGETGALTPLEDPHGRTAAGRGAGLTPRGLISSRPPVTRWPRRNHAHRRCRLARVDPGTDPGV